MSPETKKSDVQLTGLVQLLRKLSSQHKVSIWRRIADELEKPARNKRAVNIYRIQKHTKDNEKIVVPGKVLGTGIIDHRVSVAAWNFSEGAKQKISNAKGLCMSIPELLEKNPKGEGIRIIG